MQKNIFLNVAAVAALTLLSACGGAEEAKPEQDMAAAEVQENVQVAENQEAAMPAGEEMPAAAEAEVEEVPATAQNDMPSEESKA